jgi:hypothetical protein
VRRVRLRLLMVMDGGKEHAVVNEQFGRPPPFVEQAGANLVAFEKWRRAADSK